LSATEADAVQGVCVPLFWMFQVVPSVLVTMTPRLADVHVPVTTMAQM